jgi:hypothetical protein
MIVGDTADNVNYFMGKGKKFAEKYFSRLPKHNTNILKECINYSKRNTKGKQNKDTLNAITF